MSGRRRTCLEQVTAALLHFYVPAVYYHTPTHAAFTDPDAAWVFIALQELLHEHSGCVMWDLLCSPQLRRLGAFRFLSREKPDYHV